jgi:hypothetical protein
MLNLPPRKVVFKKVSEWVKAVNFALNKPKKGIINERDNCFLELLKEDMEINLPSTIVEFPVKLNLFDVTTAKPFLNTQEGERTLKFLKAKKRNGYITSVIIWILLFAAIFIMFYTGHYIYAIISVFGGFYLVSLLCKSVIEKSKDCNELSKGIITYHQAIVEELVSKYFNNTAYFSVNTETLIYNNNLCVYLSTESGNLIIYKKQNIKEIIRERVHLGSYNRKEQYEWHLDILTDFLPCPKISLILPDTKAIEDEITKAYAVLKP